MSDAGAVSIAGAVTAAPTEREARALRRGSPGLEVARSGVGWRRAAAWAARPAAVAAGGVAVAGLAGALGSDLDPGDVVVASDVRAASVVGERSSGSCAVRARSCPSAPVLVASLARLGIRARIGPVLSTDDPLSLTERAALASSGALAVDTESAWLAAAAPDRPFAVLRVISDGAGREVTDASAASAAGRALTVLRASAPGLASWSRALRPRRVLLAGPRSFCAGVERAIDTVERAVARFGPPVYVRKQIVHNAHVVEDLERRGAVFVDSLTEVPRRATVVLSAHGVSPEVRSEAAERHLRVIDATCPLVNKVHVEARRFANEGYRIVLIGHEGHEEVEGTLGEAPGRMDLVSTADAVDDLRIGPEERVAFLAQTTLATDDVDDIVGALRGRFPEAVGPGSDDVCYATQNRQDAVRAVARRSDAVIVVGSANSSNSNRLAEVAEREGCESHLVEDATELDPEWIARATSVGLTAGASAPEALVGDVVDALAGLGPVELEESSVTTERVRFRAPDAVR